MERVNPTYSIGSVSYFGQVDTYLSPILEQYYKSKKRIGVVHWWGVLTEIMDNPLVLEEFVRSVDVCFIISEERLGDPGFGTWLPTKARFDLLQQYNVFWVLFAEEPLMPNSDRCFNYPWFAKRRLAFPSDFVPTLDYVEKQYTFNMLLGSSNNHRNHLFEGCKNNKKVYRTYFGSNYLKSWSNTHLEDKEVLNNLQGQNVDGRKINTLEEVSQGPISHIIPEDIYNHSHFDIVSETCIDNGFFFVSEKTAKPLSTGRWFISYAAHETFSYLEKHGFDFSDYQLDYDVEDNMYRLELMVQKINEISKDNSLVEHIYSETKANRVHNMNVYEKLMQNVYQDLTDFVNGTLDN